MPVAQRAAVRAQLQPLSLGSAPHSQVAVGHDDGAREKYGARQAQGVANVRGVGRVAHQRRGGEVDLDDAPWEGDGRQEERREAPGEGDEEQRPPPRHQGGALQRVKHRHVPLQADHGQRVHARGVDGGVAEGHDVAQGVGSVRVALQHAYRQVQGHYQEPEGGVRNGQGQQEVPGVSGPARYGGRNHQEHRDVPQSDHDAQNDDDSDFDGPVSQLLEARGVRAWQGAFGWRRPAHRRVHFSSQCHTGKQNMNGMKANKIRNRKRLKANRTGSRCGSVFHCNNQQHLRQLVLQGPRSALQGCSRIQWVTTPPAGLKPLLFHFRQKSALNQSLVPVCTSVWNEGGFSPPEPFLYLENKGINAFIWGKKRILIVLGKCKHQIEGRRFNWIK